MTYYNGRETNNDFTIDTISSFEQSFFPRKESENLINFFPRFEREH